MSFNFSNQTQQADFVKDNPGKAVKYGLKGRRKKKRPSAAQMAAMRRRMQGGS